MKIKYLLLICLFSSINLLYSQSIFAKLSFQNDNLLFGSLNANFYSFNTKTKKQNWVFKADNAIYAQAEIVNNKIIFGDDKGIIYCISSDGKEIWKRNLGTYNGVVNKPIILNENILVTSASKFFIINQNDGTVILTFYADRPIFSPISLTSKNEIIFADLTGKIYKLSSEGKLIGSFQAIEKAIFGKIIIDNNSLFFGSNDNNFYKYSLEKQNIVFKIKTDDYVSSTPIEDENYIYFGNDSGNFYCVSKNEEKIKWQFKTAAGVRNEALLIEDKVIFGSDDKNLYIINKISGKLIKKFLVREKIKSSPILFNKSIYFADNTGEIYQIDPTFKSIKTIFKATNNNMETMKEVETVKKN